MKIKKLFFIKLAVLLGVFATILSGCGHQHTWTEATCTEPKTCSVCDATEGEALGHTWTEATCTEPKTCSVCGTTEGDALGHNFAGNTCTQCGDTFDPLSELLAEYQAEDYPQYQDYVESGERAALVDLTHDGVPELLVVSGDFENRAFQIEIYRIKGKLISLMYKTETGSSHPTTRDLYLTAVNGEWYIMYSLAYSGQGATDRCYSIYYLDEAGNEILYEQNDGLSYTYYNDENDHSKGVMAPEFELIYDESDEEFMRVYNEYIQMLEMYRSGSVVIASGNWPTEEKSACDLPDAGELYDLS